MKSLLTLLLSVTLLGFTGNLLAKEKPYVPKDNEELYGTWVNEKYHHKKVVFFSDGTYGVTINPKDELGFKDTYQITAKWTDTEGNIWYKAFLESSYRGPGYWLIKISNSGNTYESVSDRGDYPTKIDSDNDHYHIFYRQ